MPEWMFQAQDRGRVTAQQLIAALRAGEPVSIAHASVEGELDAIDDPHPLVVHDTVFAGRFDVSDCRFAKRVSLLSWIVVPLFVAGISGLLKKT